MTRRELKVGDVLYYVPNDSGQIDLWNKEVEVVKVGRKWATLANRQGRISLESWEKDENDYSSGGRCYENEEEWREIKEKRRVQSIFQRNLFSVYSIPEELTKQDMLEIAHKLGFLDRFTLEEAQS